MLAVSRDEGYAIRERVFGSLTARGTDLYFLENPYYGSRRDGRGPSEITAADHGLMALGMVLEASAASCAALATGASASAIYTPGLLSRSVDFNTLGTSARERLQQLFEVADITNFRPRFE